MLLSWKFQKIAGFQASQPPSLKPLTMRKGSSLRLILLFEKGQQACSNRDAGAEGELLKMRSKDISPRRQAPGVRHQGVDLGIVLNRGIGS
jgi:hypothetical protein